MVGHVIVIGDDYYAHRIDRDSAPGGAAIIARIFDRAAVAGRRCVEALVARLAELDATDHLVDRRHAPHVALGEVGLAKRMPQRDDLRRRAFGGLDKTGSASCRERVCTYV